MVNRSMRIISRGRTIIVLRGSPPLFMNDSTPKPRKEWTPERKAAIKKAMDEARKAIVKHIKRQHELGLNGLEDKKDSQ